MTLFFRLLIYCGIMISPAPASMLSTGYVLTNLHDSLDYQLVVRTLNQLPQLHDFAYIDQESFFQNTVLIDSSHTLLLQCLAETEKLSGSKPTLKTELLKGVLWHQLALLRVTAADKKADSIFTHAAGRFKDQAAGPWFRAVSRLGRGSPFSGLRTLDSLSANGLPDNAFWADYGEQTFLTFFPGNKKSLWDVVSVFATPACSTITPAALPAEVPQVNKWSVIPDTGRRALPTFIYELNFSYPRKLDNQSLLQPGSYAYVRNEGWLLPQFYSSFSYNRNFFNNPRNPSACYVVFDLSASPYLLERFVRDNLPQAYDSIAVSNDYAPQQAFSIKCFQRRAPRDHYGSYAWFIGFERYCDDHARFRLMSPNPPAGKPIRYLLALVSCVNDREKAEAAVQPIIDAFVYGAD